MRSHRPGPDQHWLLGAWPELRRDPLAFFDRCAGEFPEVAYFRLGPLRCCVVNDPALVEEVMVGQADRMRKASWDQEALELVLGEGLLTSEGEGWRTDRRRLQPAFRRDRLVPLARGLVDRTVALAGGWEAGERVDVHTEMARLTLENLTAGLFGLEMTRPEVRSVQRALDDVMAGFEALIRSPLPLPVWVPTPTNLRGRRAASRLREVVEGLVERRRRPGEEGDDLMGRLLTAAREGSLSEERLRDHVTTFLLAGHETTALALAWCLWLLARHPETQRRVREELEETLEGGRPRAEDVERLEWTDRSLTEAMRLYPPAWGIGREPLEDLEIGGWPLAEGTQVFLVQWSLHRDPRFYERPGAFRPERWTEELRSELPRFAYLPFGGGPRHCVGRNFATLEATLVLATLLRRWRFEPAEGAEPEPRPAVTLRPDGGVPLVVRKA